MKKNSNGISDELEKEFNAIPSDEEIMQMYKFSEKHEQKMQEIFESINDSADKCSSKNTKSRMYMFYRTAAAIFLVAVFTFVSLKYVPQVCAYFESDNMDVVIGDRVEFGSKDDNNQSGQKYESVKFELGYVPEGYEFESETYTDRDSYSITYKHEDGSDLVFSYRYLSDTKSFVDDGIYEIVDICGVTYYVFRYKDELDNDVIIWKQKNYMFKLSGRMDGTFLLDIAKNVIIKK